MPIKVDYTDKITRYWECPKCGCDQSVDSDDGILEATCENCGSTFEWGEEY